MVDRVMRAIERISTKLSSFPFSRFVNEGLENIVLPSCRSIENMKFVEIQLLTGVVGSNECVKDYMPLMLTFVPLPSFLPSFLPSSLTLGRVEATIISLQSFHCTWMLTSRYKFNTGGWHRD